MSIKLDKKGIAQASRSLCLSIKRELENGNKTNALKRYKNEVESKGLRCGCVQNYIMRNQNG